MKKILIGLLVIAAATAAYFLLYKKNEEKPITQASNQELIIGKWKTISALPLTDTLQVLYSYDFQKEGKVFRSILDSVKADTLFYDWDKNGGLLLKKNPADTSAITYTATFTGGDSLTLNVDSTNIQLVKQK